LDPPKVAFREPSSEQDASEAIHDATYSSRDSATNEWTHDASEAGFPLLPGNTWESVRSQLIDNAGFYLRRVEVNDKELVLHGNQTHYLYLPESVGRGTRVLDNAVAPDIEWFTFEYNRQGLPVAQTSVSRSALKAYATRDIDLDALARNVELNPPGSSREGTIVYDRPFAAGWSFGLSPGLKEIIGGPDGLILY